MVRMRKLGSLAVAAVVLFGCSYIPLIGTKEEEDNTALVLALAVLASANSASVAVGGLCTATAQCDPNSVCYSGRCVGNGAYRISLTWTALTDLDLHVTPPGSSEIYFANRSSGGGTLDVDDCVGEVCASPSGTHVENIVFPSTPRSGTYSLFVRNYDGAASASYRIEVFQAGTLRGTQTGTLAATAGADSTTYTATY